MYIPSNTSAAPSHMIADWTRNSIGESSVQLLLSGVYGIDWSSHDISTKTNISVYNAAITSALLFGAETWTLYQRHFVRLRRVQQHLHFHIPTESPMVKSLTELACPTLKRTFARCNSGGLVMWHACQMTESQNSCCLASSQPGQ